MKTARVKYDDLFRRARYLLRVIEERTNSDRDHPARVWGIPRGGTHVANIMEALDLPGGTIRVVTSPQDADVAVDEIVDTGRTAECVLKDHGLRTVALYDRRAAAPAELRYTAPEWLVFPWEADEVPGGESS